MIYGLKSGTVDQGPVVITVALLSVIAGRCKLNKPQRNKVKLQTELPYVSVLLV